MTDLHDHDIHTPDQPYRAEDATTDHGAAAAASPEDLTRRIADRISTVVAGLASAHHAVVAAEQDQQRALAAVTEARAGYTSQLDAALADPYVTPELLAEFGYPVPAPEPKKSATRKRPAQNRRSRKQATAGAAGENTMHPNGPL